ncbi:MAG: hypothetical protein L3J88_07110 [Gammaproteobacteria bacterium]|nr:hypothetical protein [Gammaproteobacteria bacterium]
MILLDFGGVGHAREALFSIVTINAKNTKKNSLEIFALSAPLQPLHPSLFWQN